MGQLFENFEINRDRRWGVVLTKLIGGSLVVHLALLWLVMYVPQVRDTVNIAALIANTRFVDKDYQATQIADGVQVVQLEKFRYPDGYFALENQIASGQAATAATPDPFAPKIISQASQQRDVVDPAASPSPTPDASASATASPAPSTSPAAAVAQATESPSPGTPLTPEEAQKELEKTAAQNNVPLPHENEINKKPLKDLAAHVNDLKNEGKLDLSKPFEVVIEATLDENGKLKNARVADKAGDENLVNLFRRTVEALNDSGFLIFLKPISQENPGATVTITIKQGEQQVLASVETESSSPANAESLAKALNNLLFFGALSRDGKDEAKLMKNTSATPDGKKVVVNFSMPRQTVLDMLKKQMVPSGA